MRSDPISGKINHSIMKLKLTSFKTLTILSIVVLTMSTLRCIDPITFESNVNRNFLVVDAQITDEPGPHLIRLGRSAAFASALDEGNELPVTGATISVIDEDGISTPFIERTNGFYLSSPNFKGEIGKTYTLHIRTPDGHQYESTPQQIPNKIAIDSVYWEVVPITIPATGFATKPVDSHAIQFYVDAVAPSNNYFFKWEWEGTYQYAAPRRPFVCFFDEVASEEAHAVSHELGLKKEVSRLPVSLKVLNYKFQRNYAYNLKLFAFEREAYVFWRQVDRQLNSMGSIFDSAPTRLTSNITNPENDDEVILGFFSAMSVSEKRTYVRRGDIDVEFMDLPTLCPGDVPEGQLDPRCIDCRNLPGNYVTPPDWWED